MNFEGGGPARALTTDPVTNDLMITLNDGRRWA